MFRKELQKIGDGLLDAASGNERGHLDATWNTLQSLAWPSNKLPWVFEEENALQQQSSTGKYG